MKSRSRGSVIRAGSGLGFFVVLALCAPFLATNRPWLASGEGNALVTAPVPFAPDDVDLRQRLRPPDRLHWLGTDDLGRDVCARLIHGARISVTAGLVAAFLALFIGSLLGSAAGLLGAATERTVLFGIDVVQALPALVLVISAAAFLGPSFFTATLLIALTAWPESARIVRAESKRLRATPFVEAARAVGASPGRLLATHILPHALAPALATAPYVLGAAILTEASLSFLGLGTPPPTPSWGRALADAHGSLVEAWWCVLPPALALLLLVLSARRLGDALSARRSA